MIFVLLIVPILYQTNFKIPIRIQGQEEKADRIRVLLYFDLTFYFYLLKYYYCIVTLTE